MIKIAHRGNYAGKNKDKENTISYIEEAISKGYDVEVDVWLINNQWFLGHDSPTEIINLSFLERLVIWSHAKNLDAYFTLWNNPKVNVFWHDKDDFVFTSKGIKWCNINTLTYDGIMVMPELNKHYITLLNTGHKPLGICSDDFRKFNL